MGLAVSVAVAQLTSRTDTHAKQISQNKDDIATNKADMNFATNFIVANKADIAKNTACCAANKAATDTNAKQISQNKDDIATVMWRDVNRATVVNKAIGTIKADITSNTLTSLRTRLTSPRTRFPFKHPYKMSTISFKHPYKPNMNNVDIAKNKADTATNTACCAANKAATDTNKADIATNTANIAKEKTLGASNYYAIQCNRLWMSSSALTTIPNDAFDKASC